MYLQLFVIFEKHCASPGRDIEKEIEKDFTIFRLSAMAKLLLIFFPPLIWDKKRFVRFYERSLRDACFKVESSKCD